MRREKKNGIEWLEFELLSLFPEVRHGVFLNLPMGEKDDPTHSKQAFDLLGIEKGVKLKQCHKTNILEVEECHESVAHFDDYDGMVTQEKGVGLLIRHADCQATIFYDPIQKALASIHCGWRGSVENIYQKTVDKMGSLYATDPADLIVCTGPSLGPDHAEFKHYKKELPPSFWEFQVRPNYFDFWAISRMQLMAAGVPEEQIEIAAICTYANEKDCFSYRRQKTTPHHGTIVGIVY